MMIAVMRVVGLVLALSSTLGACASVKAGYNSPLTPPGEGRLSDAVIPLYGHWTGVELGAAKPKPRFLYVGKAKLVGKRRSERNERLAIILMDPEDPEGWSISASHVSEIAGKRFLNMLMGSKGDEQLWRFASFDLNENSTQLKIQPLENITMEQFKEAGIVDMDTKNEGAVVAEYIRRFGVETLLSDDKAIFEPTNPGVDRFTK